MMPSAGTIRRPFRFAGVHLIPRSLPLPTENKKRMNEVALPIADGAELFGCDWHFSCASQCLQNGWRTGNLFIDPIFS
jgi:hypothetical protein